jgi:glycosyltransferase involved in cell wall biosynthesis
MQVGVLEQFHSVAVVIPVYNGRKTLAAVVESLQMFFSPAVSPEGLVFKITEVILVYDCGTDGSEEVLRELEQTYLPVKVVWLTRNYGQHAATLAGMASTTSAWIITIDEDGQQNPSDRARMLDVAISHGAQLVYAVPMNKPPHGVFRNLASRVTKGPISRLLTGGEVQNFNSFRLVLGEIGRTLAAYVGRGVYLDVALGWVVRKTATCEVHLRNEGGRTSSYNSRSLMSHFWRLVLSSGTRLLRIASLAGVISFLVGVCLAGTVVLGKLFFDYPVRGWASVFVALLLFGGLILLFTGIIAEYIGLLVRTSIGQPLYVIGSDPEKSSLGHRSTNG